MALLHSFLLEMLNLVVPIYHLAMACVDKLKILVDNLEVGVASWFSPHPFLKIRHTCFLLFLSLQ